ncbi:DUF5753 domain-containing protein [Streptomyces sp. NPDC006365]|uniref:DUF5753 domain-containing protein n=1 Tax=Streptomyces sp. NPDC006365 TaxID=3364744 RepID=UPI0036B119ED
MLIPGLLQTKEYARELIGHDCPPLDEETIEERVAARLKRQEKLTSKPLAHFTFVMHEAALRGVVGDQAVMRRQLEYLLKVGELRNVTLQVLSFALAPTVALSGALILVETVEHDVYAHVEAQETGALYADGDKISALAQRYGMIRSQALNVEESARFMRKLAEEL